MLEKLRISGRNIDIGGSSNVTLITPKGAIKVKRFTIKRCRLVRTSICWICSYLTITLKVYIMTDFKTGGVPTPDYDSDDINYI